MEIACAHACGGFSEERDRCTLFVKNLPSTVSVKDIKALSKDIREVRLRIMVRAKNRQKKKLRYVARACVEVGDEMVGATFNALCVSEQGRAPLFPDSSGHERVMSSDRRIRVPL